MKDIHYPKYINMLLALTAIIVMATFYYGVRVVILVVVGIVTNFIVSRFFMFMFGIKGSKGDLSFMITPILITMLMPANVPYYVIILGCIVASAIAVYPFGGTGKNIFNPAAVAVSFITLCWPNIVNYYPAIGTVEPFNTEVASTFTSHVSTLRLGAIPNVSIPELMVGEFTGPIGVTAVTVLVACAVFLVISKTISFAIVASTFGTVLFGLILFTNSSDNNLTITFYHITTSSFLFCLTFMASDPITSPNKSYARVIYGIVLGILFLLYQYYGATINTFVFPLLAVNALAHTFDEYEDEYKNAFIKLFSFLKGSKATKKVEAVVGGEKDA